ncbi:hypothetical protein NQ318_017229 [Aromia moschata]|uniref:Uncharacterized protein n=1 Tax=Aromia moschata TaxID=1265417 RepID=A0AAV8YNN2_9CUCU|nr:hypothetical protein NQ318_017229 [Aromia moschata]
MWHRQSGDGGRPETSSCRRKRLRSHSSKIIHQLIDLRSLTLSKYLWNRMLRWKLERDGNYFACLLLVYLFDAF